MQQDTGGADDTAVIGALVRDLMFASRIRGVAASAAVAQQAARLLEQLGPRTELVIVELEAAGALDAIRGIRERAPDARVVAFGPHVLETLLAEAADAGAEVMPRGQFVKQLPALVSAVRGR